MQFQLIIGLVIAVLVVLYVYLKKTKGHKESNLPAISEDINLPVVSEDVNLPATVPTPPVQTLTPEPTQSEHPTIQ